MRSSSRLVRSFTVALLPIAVIVPAACSGSDSSQTVQVRGADVAFGAAVDNTAGESVKVTVESEVEQKGGLTTRATSSGVRVGNRSSMTLDFGDAEPLDGVSMAVVADGPRQFLRYSGMPAGSPFPTGWIELTGVGAANVVTSSASLDQYLAAFKADGAKVKDLGSKKVDGVMVRQYSTVIDLSASMGDLETSNRTFARLLDAMKQNLKQVPTRIDVDSEQRIVRMVTNQETDVATTRTVITLSDFGGDFDIAIPEDATSMTIDEFAGLAYPEASPEDAPAVDEADLISRDDFIDALAEVDGMTDALAGCVYDELRASRPSTLTDAALNAAEPSEADNAAFASAGMICGAGG